MYFVSGLYHILTSTVCACLDILSPRTSSGFLACPPFGRKMKLLWNYICKFCKLLSRFDESLKILVGHISLLKHQTLFLFAWISFNILCLCWHKLFLSGGKGMKLPLLEITVSANPLNVFGLACFNFYSLPLSSAIYWSCYILSVIVSLGGSYGQYRPNYSNKTVCPKLCNCKKLYPGFTCILPW